MNKLKSYINFVNELKSSTWKSAADKADEHGQVNLSQKLRNKYKDQLEYEREEEKRRKEEERKAEWEKRKSENLELQIIDEYRYDFYLHYYQLSESDEQEYDGIVKMEIIDCDPNFSPESVVFFVNFETPEGNSLPGVGEHNYVMAYIMIEDESPYITYSQDNVSKFANRRSVLNFLKTLKKLYHVQNYNKMAKAMASINNAKISEVENGPFHRFINEQFGSWEGFISKINLRKLYDVY